MSAIIILLIASISVAALFLLAFLWSVRSGQYDDEVSPPMRILFDDKPVAAGLPQETTSIERPKSTITDSQA